MPRRHRRTPASLIPASLIRNCVTAAFMLVAATSVVLHPHTRERQVRCSTNKDCVGAYGSEPSICQQTTKRCVRLTSPECTVLAEDSDISDDTTVWVGLVTNASDRPLRPLAVDFARHEFATVGGLPPAKPGGLRRPYAFVSCDSTKGIDPIFTHLVRDLKLPAIIGPNYSSDALQALTKYTLPARAIMLATPTAPVFTTTTTNGLFLRTLASDAWQGKVLALLLNQFVEQELRLTGVIAPGEQIKMFLAYRDDVYGQYLAKVLRSELRFNGKTAAANGDRFQADDYGDPNDPNKSSDAKYESTAAKILALQPHVIAIMGSVEAEKIIRTVEQRWPGGLSYRPRWVGSESVTVAMVRVGNVHPSLPQRFLHANVRINFESSMARSLLSAIALKHPDVIKKDPRSPSLSR